jgi:hypothetical protein
MIDTVRVCPLGSECERIVDGKLEICMWQVHLEGKNPQNGKDVDRKDCAMAVLPILMVQATEASRQISSSADSVRNVILEGLKGVGNTQNKRLQSGS